MFDHAIIDLDGTVYHGSDLVAGARTAIETVREQGISVTFLTNNATKLRTQYSAKLNKMGVNTEPAEILTAGKITATYLAAEHPDSELFVIGEGPFRTTLQNHGVSVTTSPERADGIVVALDREFDYEMLSETLQIFESGDPLYVATNPDQTRPGETHSLPSTGTLIGAIQGMTGRSPEKILGKPSPEGGKVLINERNIDTDRAILVGDRIGTDIQFGNSLEMETALVLTGVADGAESGPERDQPDHVLDSISELPTLLPNS